MTNNPQAPSDTVASTPNAAALLAREWLVTDGLGGYASGTVAGANTRRYHGLLIAPLAPPVGRHVLVSSLQEAVRVGGEVVLLACNEFEGGHINPRGYEHLKHFALVDGTPVWRYAAAGGVLEKRIWMERGRSATYVSYRWDGPIGATLSLTPLCSFREFHHQTVGSDDWRFRVDRFEAERGWAGGLRVRAYAGATPYVLLVRPPDGVPWQMGGCEGWWWHFLHREELARGQDCLEDSYAVGELTCQIDPGQTLLFCAALDVHAAPDIPHSPPVDVEAPTGRDAPDEGRTSDGAVLAQLSRAAQQFLVTRALPGEPLSANQHGETQARTVLAGYHWFGDWGRDTFIALPGLAAATGRHDECRAIVTAFAKYVDKGMLPNRFPDTGAALNDGDYNTVDASMWYFHAVHALDRMTGGGLVSEVYGTMRDIVEWHIKGARFGIGMDPADAMIHVENPQLTWMDAKVGDWVCTPRAGKPVEINALWLRALSLMEVWSRMLQRPLRELRQYSELRLQASESFERFWYAPGGYLYDTLDGPQGPDASLRPNQIIAAALADTPLAAAQRKAVVDVVVSRLWTPRGLRTLDPADPRYRGRYEGDVWARDGAYHQGTVWPWPLGSLVDAHLLVYGDEAAARRLVEPLHEHLWDEACAGSVNEIFDGDAPHTPRGCIAQAWSVSEVYRAWIATQTGGEAGDTRTAHRKVM